MNPNAHLSLQMSRPRLFAILSVLLITSLCAASVNLTLGPSSQSAYAARSIWQACSSPNLISNGDFSSGNLSPWGPIAPSDFSVINGSAHMSTTGTLVQSFSAVVGTRYYGSGWLRINNQIAAPTNGGLVALVFNENFALETNSVYHTSTNAPVGTWTKFTFVFTPTTATNFMYLRNSNFSGQQDGQFDADFDNIVISTCENFLTPTPTLSPVCTNLIQNGNFASGNLPPWGPVGPSDFSVINGSAHMSTTGTLVQSFSATVGTKYYGSGWLRINNQIAAPASGGLVAIVFNESFSLATSSVYHTISSSPAGTWTKLTFVFTPTTTTNYLFLRNTNFAGQPDGQFDADFDNIIVTTCENAANPSPGSLAIYMPIVLR